jgi:hypothetical protein
MQKEVNEERGKGRMGQLKEDWREKEGRENRIKKEREIKYRRNKSKRSVHVSRTLQQHTEGEQQRSGCGGSKKHVTNTLTGNRAHLCLGRETAGDRVGKYLVQPPGFLKSGPDPWDFLYDRGGCFSQAG